jgi:isopentenyl-diphosphate delta-isomerase
MSDISQRKSDHLRLAVEGDVAFRNRSALFECVELVHNALPEVHFDDVNLEVNVLGKLLKAPLLIAGMTGGTSEAGRINRELASVAEEHGYAFGLGSQRAMLKNPSQVSTFQVRDVAPDALLLGNIGMTQARELATEQLGELCERVGADALCVHLNPAMELIQAEGDRDFRGGEELFRRLAADLLIPVIAKETGCGIAPGVARRLLACGVRHVDVSGAGGTSWVAVETLRAAEAQKKLGEQFWDWGIPTAASVALLAPLGFRTIFATGGVSNGMTVAKAVALGASVCGVARPVLQALESGGRAGAVAHLKQIELELRAAMVLVGAANICALRSAPRVIRGELRDWTSQLATGVAQQPGST